jgi:hypothetical protein
MKGGNVIFVYGRHIDRSIYQLNKKVVLDGIFNIVLSIFLKTQLDQFYQVQSIRCNMASSIKQITLLPLTLHCKAYS